MSDRVDGNSNAPLIPDETFESILLGLSYLETWVNDTSDEIFYKNFSDHELLQAVGSFAAFYINMEAALGEPGITGSLILDRVRETLISLNQKKQEG